MKLKSDVNARPLWLRIAVALLAVAGAALIRWALDPWVGAGRQFQTMYGAVAVAVWFGGWEAGCLATIAGFVVANILFIPPRGVLTLRTPEVWFALIGYGLSCAVIICLGAAMRRAQRRAEDEARERRETARQQEALYRLARELQSTKSFSEIYDAALSAIVEGLHCDRASILLFDEQGVMRFVAWRGLSDVYRERVEGHSPWTPDTTDAQPIAISDIAHANLEDGLKATVRNEGIGACAFIPLVADGRVIGKFMSYCDAPRVFSARELDTGVTIGRQLASAVQRQRAEEGLRASEERLRIATSTGKVGAWEWDLTANKVSWSDALYPMHGLDKATFGGAVDDLSKLVHPEDYERVAAATRRSVTEGAPYELTFRVIKPDGETIWVFTNGVVVRDGDKPVRMIGATTDITELKRAEEALQQAKSVADEANKAKDQFLAMLSHELRTPLTPVLMSASMLEQDERLPANVREQLAMIRRNVELEARLIDDLLDVTRIAHGKLELQEEVVDLHALIEEALRMSAADLLGKHLQVTKYFEASMKRCHADRARLQEVFWNIIRNAVKFTPDHGQLVIATRNDERQQIVIEFSDSGIGIEPELQPRIFDAFAQGERAMGSRFGGLGLGLAISKRIIDLHGGTLEARSAGRGQGSTFIITLSAVAELSARPAEPMADLAPVTPAASRMLIVEDHEDTARVLCRILETSGYQVVLARSVLEARTLAADQQFDIVISDLGLPDGSGLDLMRDLHSTSNSNMIGIAVSGYGTAEDIRASEEAGFSAHLTKPVDVERLQSAIRSARSKITTVRPMLPQQPEPRSLTTQI